MRGCEFQLDKPQVELGPDVRHAVISDNLMKGKLRIKTAGEKNRFQIHDNATDEAQP